MRCEAGARDAFAAGRADEASVRLDLFIVGEQTAIDAGCFGKQSLPCSRSKVIVKEMGHVQFIHAFAIRGGRK